MLFSSNRVMPLQAEQPLPPGTGLGSGLANRSLQPMSNIGRHGSVPGIVSQHLLHIRKLERGLLLVLLQRRLLLLPFFFPRSKFILMFHDSSALLKQKVESFARA